MRGLDLGARIAIATLYGRMRIARERRDNYLEIFGGEHPAYVDAIGAYIALHNALVAAHSAILATVHLSNEPEANPRAAKDFLTAIAHSARIRRKSYQELVARGPKRR